jgi:hypothetical protein
VSDALKAEGVAAPPLLDGPAGSEVWGEWLNRACGADAVTRVGVPPKDMPNALVDLAPTLGDAPFIADIPFGMIWTQDGQLDVTRGIAKSLGGYAIALSAPLGPDTARFDPWGYAPDGLHLMKGLRAKWDPRGQCNPGAFVV